MNTAEKRNQELEKKKLSIKMMYYNRYLLIRYLTAFFFFIHLNWLALLLFAGSDWLVLPLGLLIAILPAVWEQVLLYRKHQSVVRMTRNYFFVQMISNLFLFGILFTDSYEELFPFMANSMETKQIVSLMIVSGIFICVFVQHRLKQIATDQDRHFGRIKQYEKILYSGKESH
ncbi:MULTISPECIES: hypothetical protein [unclassified Enterococcus]|uniref:hypothetical protein n=1 Tax=unclassified Enterococcus TaxID=2608891 RepID=UPI0013EA863A|nr:MULTISPECIES: hypothetical protein [unclassified Enterococcus]